MTGRDDYKAKTAEAQREADRAPSEVERTAWLRVVQGWLGKKQTRSDDAEK
jgi:hypothetical protein